MAHVSSPQLAMSPRVVSSERRIMRSASMQRRMELEKEVAELQKMLEDEKKVHEILERALLPNSFQFILQIPGFLPNKAKELLAELIIVEEEIGRLENEIEKIRGGLREIKTTPNPRNDQEMQEKVAKEMKSMFFINKAIKEDKYSNLNAQVIDLKGRRSVEEKGSLRILMHKEHASPRKSGILAKQAFLDFSPKKSLEKPTNTNTEKLLKIFQDPSGTVVSEKSDSQKLQFQPNKLSERILKCLICIFQRLLRTSKIAELEKTNNISRKSGGILFNKALSLRTEPCTNLKAGQLDPYGVFETEDSVLRDIGAYKNLVRFSAGSLDVKGFSASFPLLNKLRDLIDALQQVDLRTLTHNQKLAFWVNVYNACIMNGFLQHGLPSNSEKLLTAKNKSVVSVGGIELTASEIEHSILRQPSKPKGSQKENFKGKKDEKEILIRNIFGLEQEEQNLVFALCFGTKSSPALRIYTPDRITSELEKSKLDYLQASLVLTSTKRLIIPNLIYSNFRDEFANNLDLLLQWIMNQLPTSWPLRKSMVECLKLQNHLRIEIMPYNDEFQYLLSM